MGLTDEKYLALMFSFSRNSPLDLMTPEYGCCLQKKRAFPPIQMCFQWLCCAGFLGFFSCLFVFHIAQLSALGKVLSSGLEQK